jgi:glutamate formiminotransferase
MKKNSTLCIIYVSEASNTSNLDALKLSIGSCSLLHSFRDVTYNRTSFFLAGQYPDVRASALELCRAAFQLLVINSSFSILFIYCFSRSRIDFRSHRGTHPTLGTVDNICFSPLGGESLDIVSSQARDFGSHLFDLINVPVYFYGSASTADDADRQIQLKSIRRQFGYFGEKSQPQVVEPYIAVNLGPSWDRIALSKSSTGISCVGAVPYIQNFNMRFSKDAQRSSVIKVTAAVRIPNKVVAKSFAFESYCMNLYKTLIIRVLHVRYPAE